MAAKLNRKTIEKVFDEVTEDGKDCLVAKKELKLETNKKTYSFTVEIKFLIPPIEYPDDFCLINYEITGWASQRYSKEMKDVLVNWLNDYHIKPIQTESLIPCYLGVIRGEEKNIPILFSPNEKPELAAEEIRFKFSGDKRITYKRWYYKWNSRYFFTDHDPLKYLVSNEQSVIESRLLKHINQRPVLISDYRYRAMSNLPFFLYDGIVPCYYFSEQLFFEDDGLGSHFIHDGKSDVYKGSDRNARTLISKGTGYNTANDLFRTVEKKYPDIRERVIIHEKALFGEEYPDYEIGEKVRIANPIGIKKASLKNIEGTIINIDGVLVKVEFLNYFIEQFHLKEIEKQ